MNKECEIVRDILPLYVDEVCSDSSREIIDEHLKECPDCTAYLEQLRASEAVLKKPSIAETLDWAQALTALGVRELTPEILRSTVGFVLKNNEDIETMAEILGAEGCDCGGDCGHHGEPGHDHAACGHHHHA